MKVRRMSYGTKATEFGVRGKKRHSLLVLLSHLILTPHPPYPVKEERPNRYSYKSVSARPTTLAAIIYNITLISFQLEMNFFIVM